MTCSHSRSIALARSRVTRVPNRMRGRMLTSECLRCRALLPVTWPFGSAKANDRIPRAEKWLAAKLVDIHLLWEPGRSRSEIIAIAVDDCTRMP